MVAALIYRVTRRIEQKKKIRVKDVIRTVRVEKKEAIGEEGPRTE